jgi:hypothetical protein
MVTAKRGWNDYNARQRLGTVRREIARRLQTSLERGWVTSAPSDPISKRVSTMNNKMLARLYRERAGLESFLLRDAVEAPYCAKLIGPCPDGCAGVKVACGRPGELHGDCWRVKQSAAA